MQNGALVSIDGLTFQPTAGTDISNVTITTSHTPLVGPGGESIKRVYQVSGPVTFSGTLGILYHEEELNGSSEASLMLAMRSNPTSSFTVPDNGVVDETANHVTAAFTSAVNLQGQVTAFSSAALPVTWVSFEAHREGMLALLSWATAAEVNTDYFAVERSADGKYFTEAGRVKATGSASGRSAAYHFSEAQTAGGTFFYRIRSVDYDGDTDVTGIRSVTIPPGAELAVFPNPSPGKVSVQGLQGTGVVKVYNLYGRLIQTQAVHSKLAEIDLSMQPGGHYLIIAELNGNIYLSKKVLKE